ncbi:virulence factor [Candidatus Kinetoplastibacterium blastocrithidii TCC012E]|uniref:Probable lipid II flippase MurJ n=1 Tax=Candidatus Kinetoplastidibacterium blastocrithidiae TCC012E TaxID=1208922 RepID=M1MD86_9PROT|nr:murein biosynthesis integral membrane protein MurJ [Candidatus Kinetoplastibacterium blastocrithidii]AFZ83596.1 virulence factor [Candidatus Kinetoplastibacterium blastocrithidii (ex Strigomonas culicis)]AGF49715.1 virulence factor [Candidatus Kinetoplastibacterium blastocrithidii TCC012E]
MTLKGTLRSVLIVSIFTLVSRATGLIRDIVIAKNIGANSLSDAFWIAFRIPNMLRKIFAEGSFAQAFIPTLSLARTESRNENSLSENIHNLITRMALLLTTSLIIITVLGIIFTPFIIKIFASGVYKNNNNNQFYVTVLMTRIMFPYVILISLTAFASCILNTWKKFSIPAITPALLNISMVLTCLVFSKETIQPIYALALGVVVGGIAQFAIQWIAISKVKLQPSVSFDFTSAYNDKYVKNIIKKMMPALLGVSVSQISLLINTNIATWLTPGSLTWLTLADRIVDLPTALIGLALGTVMLPDLSKSYINNDHDKYKLLINNSLKIIMLFGIPSMVCMISIPNGLVTVLFHYGEFNQIDVYNTKLAVLAYSIGLLGMMSIKILSSAFYAMQDTITPTKTSLLSLFLAQTLNIFLVPLYSHVGIAISYSVGATLNSLFMLFLLTKNKVFKSYKNSWITMLLRLVPSSILMGIFLNLFENKINWIELQSSIIQRFSLLSFVLIVGFIIYTASLFIFGMRSKDFLSLFITK